MAEANNKAEAKGRFYIFGATGRTGLPFLEYALERGHQVTAFVRNSKKIPANLLENKSLTVVQGELSDAKLIEKSIEESQPHVIYGMLASDYAPHTQVSTSIENSLVAINSAKARVPSLEKTRLIVIAGWGLGPSYKYLNFAERALVKVAQLVYGKAMIDFARALDLTEKQPATKSTFLLPPFLTNGPLTGQYQSGDIDKVPTSVYQTIARRDMAHYALGLGEKVVADSDVELPPFVSIHY